MKVGLMAEEAPIGNDEPRGAVPLPTLSGTATYPQM
jgi:hypothetical protein